MASLFSAVLAAVFAVDLLARAGRFAGKVLFAHAVQVAVVGLQGEHVVSTLLNDLLGNGLLAPHGINRDDAALHVQQFQELRDGGDLVGFAVHFALTEQHAHVSGPSAEHVQRRARAASRCRAADGFAIDGNHAFDFAYGAAHPLQASRFERLLVEAAKHTRKSVVRSDTRGQVKKALEPIVVSLTKLGHFDPVVCAANGGAQGDGQ